MFIKEISTMEELAQMIEERSTLPPGEDVDGESAAKRLLCSWFRFGRRGFDQDTWPKDYMEEHGHIKVGNYNNKFFPLWEEGEI